MYARKQAQIRANTEGARIALYYGAWGLDYFTSLRLDQASNTITLIRVFKPEAVK